MRCFKKMWYFFCFIFMILFVLIDEKRKQMKNINHFSLINSGHNTASPSCSPSTPAPPHPNPRPPHLPSSVVITIDWKAFRLFLANFITSSQKCLRGRLMKNYCWWLVGSLMVAVEWELEVEEASLATCWRRKMMLDPFAFVVDCQSLRECSSVVAGFEA